MQFISGLELKLVYFLAVSAILFGIGLYGVLTRRHLVHILLSVELILNAVLINLVAFSAFVTPEKLTGQMFAVFLIVVAACEVGVGLAIILSVYRRRKTVDVDNINILKW
ncbi:MAG: NADH-quinone oxidoreductase subunit NuoK [Actinobacteria bacterium]|nr:NADH-quinone oxidoreductase subunit NuoK [Actinomycetota bacterium]